jgi:predicted DNA-binding transcriptional regulator AlpA
VPVKAVSNSTTIENTTSAPDLGLLTPRQLAEELHMSVRTLARLHDTRNGPPRVTLGRHLYYRRAAVDQWLVRCEGFVRACPAPRRKPVSPAGRNARRARRTA